tara:strand:- start:524 stop:883 length:360 start_codon:yes stop_codon:yes gene_type:complete
MAYLKPNNTVFIVNGGRPITSLVKKVAFRRYLANTRDRKTGKKKKKLKSMPFAICEVKVSADPAIPVGSEFLIQGYKLKNVVMKGERILVLHDQYITEFADRYGNEWVRKLIEQEQKEA